MLTSLNGQSLASGPGESPQSEEGPTSLLLARNGLVYDPSDPKCYPREIRAFQHYQPEADVSRASCSKPLNGVWLVAPSRRTSPDSRSLLQIGCRRPKERPALPIDAIHRGTDGRVPLQRAVPTILHPCILRDGESSTEACLRLGSIRRGAGEQEFPTVSVKFGLDPADPHLVAPLQGILRVCKAARNRLVCLCASASRLRKYGSHIWAPVAA